MPVYENMEVLSKSSNASVLKMPGRKFPSLVIQGDSLNNLHNLLKEAIGCLKKAEINEGIEVCEEAEEILRALKKSYEETLLEQDILLPYNKRS